MSGEHEEIDDEDNPEFTEKDFARAVPFAQMFPEEAAALKRQGGRLRLGQAEGQTPTEEKP